MSINNNDLLDNKSVKKLYYAFTNITYDNILLVSIYGINIGLIIKLAKFGS